LDLAAVILLGLVTLIALLVPVLAPHDPKLPINVPYLSPGHGGVLGTDQVGRDLFSRILYGLRASWLAALVVIGAGVLIGGIVGVIAGMVGGALDTVLMRITDGFLALPAAILAIALVASLGASFAHVIEAIIVVWWPYYARMVRSEVRALAARPHLEAARLSGVSRWRLATRHLLPGAIPVVLVAASLDVGSVILTLASLSYLGLGAPAPAPELGAMSAQGLTHLLTYWWIPVLPAVAVFVLCLIANLAGDSVRDLFESR
jgi:peptide/nickel transport system permease protein